MRNAVAGGKTKRRVCDTPVVLSQGKVKFLLKTGREKRIKPGPTNQR